MNKLHDVITSLNDEQVEALLELGKPLRILAGAGSGKTRVITGKIGHLIENENINQNRILALTFTNKAAKEMKERINDLIGKIPRYITTFHSFGVRVLREEYSSCGLNPGFEIIDSSDQVTIIKRLIKENGLVTNAKEKEIIGYISRWKGWRYDGSTDSATNHKEIQILKVYSLYLNYLKVNNSIDFDDLILKVEDLFLSNKEVLTKWIQKFDYILVDEFQDTSTSQYNIVKLLLGNRSCLTVVGDPDQNIYSWRGSELSIILDFEKNFKNARTIFLNKNYRSTQKILDVANNFIDHNKMREKKDIYSDTKSGKVVHVKETASVNFEAKYIANKINELVDKGYKYSDFFILYRNHAISRPFETSFQNQKIPFEIFGGLAFRDRSVVKDLSAMIKMITHGHAIAFGRVFKHVPRIGAVTIEKIVELAKLKNTTILNLFVEHFGELQTISKNLTSFREMLVGAISMVDNNDKPVDVLKYIVSRIGYELQFNTTAREDVEAKANILTFYDQLDSYIEMLENDIKDTREIFVNFLQNEAIDITNEITDEVVANKVVMSTVHGVKGLEKRVVFIVGVNNNVFPSKFSKISINSLEEERRLFYVAVTRAKEELFIMYSVGQYSHLAGETLSISRFIEEIDPKLYELESNIFFHGSSVNDMTSKIIVPVVEAKPLNKSTNDVIKGDKVEHAAFGVGIVVSIQGKFLSIAFTDPRHKVKMIPLNSNVWWKIN
ncbi:ATP-dependent helicase [Spiroplasma endosymbiont of Othius punctulatus]|uniref:ATP-dependent helicase n=1 Tax=Spiroplasma endosymbiont of Othius punctulatus TaxID=3066289 RepID=UPI0030CB6FDF